MKNTCLLLALFIVSQLHAQEEYVLDSECPSICRFFHLAPDGSALTIVYESCDEDNMDARVHICTTEVESLVPQLSFEAEWPDGLYSNEEGFYLISRNNETYFLRFINNDLNVISEVELDMSIYTDIKEIYINDGFLVMASFRFTSFYLDRFDVESGSIVETISFAGLPPVGDFQTDMHVLDSETIYVGLVCGWIFKFDPLNLSETELLPLPFSEEIDDTYIPCSNIDDLLRAHPNENILFSAASAVILEDYYSFDFGYNGEHLTTNFLLLPEEYIPMNFIFDQDETKYLLFLESINDGGVVSKDIGMYKINQENEVVDSLFYQTPDWLQGGYSMRLNENTIHLYGYKSHHQTPDLFQASYLTVDSNNFGTNVSSVQAEAPKFIQTGEVFGVLPGSQVHLQQVFDLSGVLHRSSQEAALWQKVEFAPGVYVLRVETEAEMSSFRVVVH